MTVEGGVENSTVGNDYGNDYVTVTGISQDVKGKLDKNTRLVVNNTVPDIYSKPVINDSKIRNDQLTVRDKVQNIYSDPFDVENEAEIVKEIFNPNPAGEILMKEMLGKFPKIKDKVTVSNSKSSLFHKQELNLQDERIQERGSQKDIVKLPKESRVSKRSAIMPQIKSKVSKSSALNPQSKSSAINLQTESKVG